jgi:hypothetical protein
MCVLVIQPAAAAAIARGNSDWDRPSHHPSPEIADQRFEKSLKIFEEGRLTPRLRRGKRRISRIRNPEALRLNGRFPTAASVVVNETLTEQRLRRGSTVRRGGNTRSPR